MASEVRFYSERNNNAQVDFRVFDLNGDLVTTLIGVQNADDVWEGNISAQPAATYDVIAVEQARNLTLGHERIYWDGTNVLTEPQQSANEVRTELTVELAHLISLENGLTAAEGTMMLEIYRLLGLDPTRPLVVTKTKRTVLPEIDQDLDDTGIQTTVTRV